jgi:hypothetical protein
MEASHLPVNDASHRPSIRVNQDTVITQITMGKVKSL